MRAAISFRSGRRFPRRWSSFTAAFQSWRASARSRSTSLSGSSFLMRAATASASETAPSCSSASRYESERATSSGKRSRGR